MSSSSADNDSGAEEGTINGDVKSAVSHTPTQEGDTNGTQQAGGRILELLAEERDDASTPEPLGNGINRFKKIPRIDDISEDGSTDALPRRPESPVDSIPDDSPSVQVVLSCPSSRTLANFGHRVPFYPLLVAVAYCLR
jgi:hypothetical protein